MGLAISASSGNISLKHDERDYKEGKYPENVDPSRSYLNEYYVTSNHKTLREIFNDFFSDSVDEYNSKQKRKDRKINDYYQKIKQSKNGETPVYEYVFQIGNKDNITDYEEAAVSVLRDYARTFQEKNPQFHVIESVMHRDESTPHLHIAFIPFSTSYKTGLQKRVSSSKALESMGFNGVDKNMKSWKRAQEEMIEEMMKEKGLEREIYGSTRGRLPSVQLYKETRDKAIADAQSEVKSLQVQKAELTEKISNEVKNLSLLKKQSQEATESLSEALHSIDVEKSTLKSLKASEELLAASIKKKQKALDKTLTSINLVQQISPENLDKVLADSITEEIIGETVYNTIDELARNDLLKIAPDEIMKEKRISLTSITSKVKQNINSLLERVTKAFKANLSRPSVIALLKKKTRESQEQARSTPTHKPQRKRPER